MSNHTPGPWHVAGRFCIEFYNRDGLEETLSEAYDMPADGEGEANARLMAAAPDMLAALRDFVRIITSREEPTDADHDEAYARARLAIAKAEGPYQ